MMTTASGARDRSCSSGSGARIFAGCKTGKFAASAVSFTGEKETSWPRPRGRSGCVNTPTISKSGCSRRYLNGGTANCGVPQNTIRRRFTAGSPARSAHLPLAFFPQLFDFALDEVALQHAQMLQEENSVQMVDFMAERPRQQVFTANLERLALQVLRAHSHKLRADDVPPKTRNREAALFLAHLSFGVNDFGIHQHNFRFRVLSGRDVHHRKAQALPDLRRSQAYALSRVHRREHVLRELCQFRVKFLVNRRWLFEHRVAVLHNRIEFARRGFGGLRLFRGGGGFRTRRFVGHNSRNSAASRRANLLQIFAEKHRRAQGQPWPPRQPHPPAPRTSPSARRPPGPAPS